MLNTEYSPIDLKDASIYAPYLEKTPERVADYTFTNLWGWGEHYGLEWKLAHNLCWIRQRFRHDRDGAPRLWAPVGDWENADWESMTELVPGTVHVARARAALHPA